MYLHTSNTLVAPFPSPQLHLISLYLHFKQVACPCKSTLVPATIIAWIPPNIATDILSPSRKNLGQYFELWPSHILVFQRLCLLPYPGPSITLPLLASKLTTPSSARSLFSKDSPTIPSGLLISNLLSNSYLFGDSLMDLLPMMLQLLETKLNESPSIREFVALLPIPSTILFFTICLITMLLQYWSFISSIHC